MPTFTPPTTTYGNVEPKSRVEMWFCNSIERGLTVLKKDGVYATVDFPYQGDCDDADICYLGGHTYEIDDDEVTALTDAGYEDCIDMGTWLELDRTNHLWNTLRTWARP